MNDATPKEVATHFAIAAAVSFSAIAAPFVPEAILAYAGYRYLRHFTYGWRHWRAPARVPLHLGRRGYRDETTRRRGDATWPVGLAATGQVWLRREDLVQGLSLHSDDRKWQAQAAANLVFGACLNRIGAIIVQSADTPLLTDWLAEVAAPFGRDGEIWAFDLREAPRPPLRITTSTLAAAITDLQLGPEASALNKALVPILEFIAARFKQNPLTLYQAFLDEAALKRLANGKYEIAGTTVGENISASSHGTALAEVLKPLSDIPSNQREIGRQALMRHTIELAASRCFSLTDGFDLRDAIAAGGLVCIRPSSPLTTALVVARCVEVLASAEPNQAGHALVHIAYPDALSGVSAKRFRAASVQAGAIGSLALPARPANRISKAIRKLCAVQIQSREAKGRIIPHAGKITSSVKECSFTLDVRLPQFSETLGLEFEEDTDHPSNDA